MKTACTASSIFSKRACGIWLAPAWRASSPDFADYAQRYAVAYIHLSLAYCGSGIRATADGAYANPGDQKEN